MITIIILIIIIMITIIIITPGVSICISIPQMSTTFQSM